MRNPFGQNWLLTWTTKGTWCPGDKRGWTSSDSGNGNHVLANPPSEGLRVWSLNQMGGSPVWLIREQAEAILRSFQETATINKWLLGGGAIMPNHVHLVLGEHEGVSSEKLVGRFKAYASRVLNQRWGKKEWWTGSYSGRLLPDNDAVMDALEYVRNQPGILVHFEMDVQQ